MPNALPSGLPPMISYCFAAYRPLYSMMLIRELISKTSVPYEILVWLNMENADLDQLIATSAAGGVSIRVIGRTTPGIGMRAYRALFAAARYPMVVQIDDDVLLISRGIAEKAAVIFERYPDVRQIVADVWQDEFTTGARPPMERYQAIYPEAGLYQGKIDGWFSIYHRAILPVLVELEYLEYFSIGVRARQALEARGMRGLLCTRMKVFHAIGPAYASLFDMIDFEIEKYRRLDRDKIVNWYVKARETLPPKPVLQESFEAAARALDVAV